MLILGIESSCDETAAAVVDENLDVRSSVIASQLGTHARYGGVVPELASREHLRAIVPVVSEALDQAGAGLDQLAAVAVTEGPGLVGSLLVGITYAKALAVSRNLPLIAVNHLEGHIHAVVMEAHQTGAEIEFPAIALVVSGGHTHLFEVFPEYRYRLLGRTRDDAAGEAYDKVAKLLGFGYLGGPVLDRLAKYGNPRAVRFTMARMKGNSLDFSFSGLKTAVLRWFEDNGVAAEAAERKRFVQSNPSPDDSAWRSMTPARTLDLIASFQHAVIHEITGRLEEAGEQRAARTIIVSGGVACNRGLREACARLRTGATVLFPQPGLSTDNAAMIAAAAFPKLERREFAGLDLTAKANLALA